jgi:hypothetical protein
MPLPNELHKKQIIYYVWIINHPPIMRSILVLALFSLLGTSAMAIKKVLVSPEPTWLYKTNADLARKPTEGRISMEPGPSIFHHFRN